MSSKSTDIVNARKGMYGFCEGLRFAKHQFLPEPEAMPEEVRRNYQILVAGAGNKQAIVLAEIDRKFGLRLRSQVRQTSSNPYRRTYDRMEEIIREYGYFPSRQDFIQMGEESLYLSMSKRGGLDLWRYLFGYEKNGRPMSSNAGRPRIYTTPWLIETLDQEFTEYRLNGNINNMWPQIKWWKRHTVSIGDDEEIPMENLRIKIYNIERQFGVVGFFAKMYGMKRKFYATSGYARRY